MSDYTVRVQLFGVGQDEDGKLPATDPIEENALTYSNLENALRVYRACEKPQQAAYESGLAEEQEPKPDA